MTNWKISSQKTVFKSELFEIKEIKLKGPNDKTKLHHDIFRRDGVFVFPITEKKEIYLISEFRYFYNKEILDVCAGFLEKGESPLATAKRELKEEVGVTATHWEELARLEISASLTKATQYLFIARDLEIGSQKLRETEEIKIVKIPLKDAIQKIYSGEIFVAPTVAGILMLAGLKLNSH
ncbi:MAG: hypothetical protein A3I49_02655 [Candidatus Levybacteria bacterium RIFCSPLOWO2_02_FULL_37_11]|nr:MAG: hypothetical protein A3I49_02655 [Candidatus Levybacteria bacterium RIFCSPLOWO2_02_FULL_37_11]